MLNGSPVLTEKIPVSCQPSTSRVPWNGKLYRPLTLNAWVTLKPQTEKSGDRSNGFEKTVGAFPESEPRTESPVPKHLEYVYDTCAWKLRVSLRLRAACKEL